MSTYNKKIWYKCINCDKKLKLAQNHSEKWVIHAEQGALNEEDIHEHQLIIQIQLL